MIAVSAYDKEMENKLLAYLLCDPDLTFHKSNQENAGAQDADMKQRMHIEAEDESVSTVWIQSPISSCQ